MANHCSLLFLGLAWQTEPPEHGMLKTQRRTGGVSLDAQWSVPFFLTRKYGLNSRCPRKRVGVEWKLHRLWQDTLFAASWTVANFFGQA